MIGPIAHGPFHDFACPLSSRKEARLHWNRRQPRRVAAETDRSMPTEPGRRRTLDPELRRRLLLEARTPWRGLRRALWLALLASAGLGLATMVMRASAGGDLASTDLLIQLLAVVICSGLLWFDRNRNGSA